MHLLVTRIDQTRVRWRFAYSLVVVSIHYSNRTGCEIVKTRLPMKFRDFPKKKGGGFQSNMSISIPIIRIHRHHLHYWFFKKN